MMIAVNVTGTQRPVDHHDASHPTGTDQDRARDGQSGGDVTRHRHRKDRRLAAMLSRWRRTRRTD
jgi:hypothetical protein